MIHQASQESAISLRSGDPYKDPISLENSARWTKAELWRPEIITSSVSRDEKQADQKLYCSIVTLPTRAVEGP